MPNHIADIVVAGKLFKSAIIKRLSSGIEPAPDLAHFSQTIEAILKASGANAICEHCWVNMPADQPPWLETEVDIDAGDEVSCFVQGRVYANRFLDIWLKPSQNIWYKIGSEGEVFRGARNAYSFKANHAGRLQIGNYFPNDWQTKQGQLKRSEEDYKEVSGESKVLIIKWKGTAINGLRTLVEAGDYQGFLSAEIERLETGDKTPTGWQYLWNLGPAEIYSKHLADNGKACIHCDTHEDVGILQYELDTSLDRDTYISWRWLVEKLPSQLREDSLPSHDYLSMAVEFDNGRNLSYYWSKSLPLGYGYDCPIPSWQDKEYHIVIRTGEAELGTWLSERRNIFKDYQSYIGEPPAKIVRVWLIANSLFQRNRGVCTYSDIVLNKTAEDIQIL